MIGSVSFSPEHATARSTTTLALLGALGLILIPLFAKSAFAQAASERVVNASLDSFIQKYAIQHYFSGALLVERNGHAIYRGHFGICEKAFSVSLSV